MPSAKAHLNGLIKMLNLLVSNQLASYSTDPSFVRKNPDIPYKAMCTILKNYKAPTGKTKSNLNVIQPNLRDELLRKFANL